MTLSYILSDINDANRCGMKQKFYSNYAPFPKKLINDLKKYGFNVSTCINKKSGIHWLGVSWGHWRADNDKR